MAADAGVVLVLPMHHRHGVPADQALDTPLEVAVAGIGHLVVLGNGVQVGRDQLARDRNAGLARSGAQGRQQLGAMLPVTRHHLVKGLDPLRYLGSKVNLCGCLKLYRHKRSLYPHLSAVILTGGKTNPHLR